MCRCNRVHRFVRRSFGIDRLNDLTDIPAVNVSTAQHHSRRLVAADPLHGRQINPGLYQLRDRGVSHDVPPDSIGIEAGCLYRLPQRTIHPSTMPAALSECGDGKSNPRDHRASCACVRVAQQVQRCRRHTQAAQYRFQILVAPQSQQRRTLVAVATSDRRARASSHQTLALAPPHPVAFPPGSFDRPWPPLLRKSSACEVAQSTVPRQSPCETQANGSSCAGCLTKMQRGDI